ncbi:hypothetical protein [Paenibacillus sp. FSL R7-0337]|uniref:hypothetical protein n=1 Tax=Paenibacillus sp. FSL R7-0337 TaxID=1926588 RepID=UPI00096E55DD|nr:hypothetical protein [Paenibacillus sp. FSL R7-0337]OMF90375.1 hypothetical protein BK147_23595 [Paenibacillus sp. FSL R7-0337]
MIEFPVYGWTVRRERVAEELLREWEQWLDQGITPVSMEYLKERNRGMILLFLFKILCSCDRLDESAWHGLLLDWAQSLIGRTRDPVLLHCTECGNPFVFDHLDFS